MNIDLDRIEKRWNEEKKISSKDVEYLLKRARNADTMESANKLRNGGLGSLFDRFGF